MGSFKFSKIELGDNVSSWCKGQLRTSPPWATVLNICLLSASENWWGESLHQWSQTKRNLHGSGNQVSYRWCHFFGFNFILFFVSTLFMFVCILHLFFCSDFWAALLLRSLSALLSNPVCQEDNFHGFPVSVLKMVRLSVWRCCFKRARRCWCMGLHMRTVRTALRESARGEKVPCRTRGSNPRQYCTRLFSWAFYQLSYSCSWLYQYIYAHMCYICNITLTLAVSFVVVDTVGYIYIYIYVYAHMCYTVTLH